MSEFEKWFKTTEAYKMLEEQNYFKMDLFLFVEARNQYRHSGVQVAYLAWQHQQAIIENLKAQLNNMEACYIEKKERVEAVGHMLEGDLKYVEQDRRGNFDFLQMAMIRCLGDALKALRGDND